MEISDQIYCHETTKFEEIVRYFYERESLDWNRGIHKRAGTVEENIQDMVTTISPDSIMYEVRAGGELAAFFVKAISEGQYVLEGFHVAIEFRKGWFLNWFWNKIDEVMGGSYLIGLCERNTVAIQHLLKQGFMCLGEKHYEGNLFLIFKK